MNKAVYLFLLGLLTGPAYASELFMGASLGLGAGGPSLDDRSSPGTGSVSRQDAQYSSTENLPVGQLSAGWALNERMTVELSAFRTAKADTVESLQMYTSIGKGTAVTPKQQQLDGIILSLSGRKPLARRLYGDLRLGVASTRRKMSYTRQSTDLLLSSGGTVMQFVMRTDNLSETEHKTGLMVGAGLNWNLGTAWEARSELTGLQLEDGKLIQLSAGIIRRF